MFHPILPPEPPVVPKDTHFNIPQTYISRAKVDNVDHKNTGINAKINTRAKLKARLKARLKTNSKTNSRTNNKKSSKLSQTLQESRKKSETSSTKKSGKAKKSDVYSQKLRIAQGTQISPQQQNVLPESFPPEFSLNAPVKGASALGKPLSVGDLNFVPTEVDESKKNVNRQETKQKIQKTVVRSKKLSLTQKLKALKKPPNVPTKQNNQNITTRNPTKTQAFSLKNSNNRSNQIPNNKSVKSPIIEFKSRQGNITKKTFTLSQQQFQITPPDNSNPQQNPQQNPSPTTPTQTPTNTPETRRVIEVIADQQEYDEKRRVITASGNVVVRFDNAIVDADSLQVSLDNLIAVGEGNVALKRGEQTLRGERFTYNFVQDTGELKGGSGEIFIPSVGSDLSFSPNAALSVTKPPLSDRAIRNQPTQGVSSPGGVNIDLGGNSRASNVPRAGSGGNVRRLRFQAGSIDFNPRGWEAKDVRITNDPFSPPELELRANTVTLTRETPLRDRIKTRGQRLVFDQGFSLGIPKDSQVIDRTERDATPAIVSVGFDGDKRGGLFVERKFETINQENLRFSITPQFFVQEAVQNGSSNIAGLFGLKAQGSAVFSPKTTFKGDASLTSLNLDDFDSNFRANLRLQQQIGNQNPHILDVQYSYRDRLYNGTLGFQTVQSSFGGVIISPRIPLGKTGLGLRYQGGAQLINANSDRLDILEDDRDNDRISLGRFQGSATIDGGIRLWQGKGLPATREKGLRYTPNPVVPYLSAFGGLTGTTSLYSNGDSQNILLATVGLQGQIGNFSKPFLDYTAFNISYSQGLNDGLSPFLFDRFVDEQVLNLGISQQIYGPVRLGFQTSINIGTGESRSTDYILEYSRRTYGISLRYNPVLELGGISFRISDFNWSGGTDPFSDESEVRSVDGGKIEN
ncbi:MAG: DUF3769 domain-containing protein [Cyanobacteria bacterium P01_A01_bin.80]